MNCEDGGTWKRYAIVRNCYGRKGGDMKADRAMTIPELRAAIKAGRADVRAWAESAYPESAYPPNSPLPDTPASFYHRERFGS